MIFLQFESPRLFSLFLNHNKQGCRSDFLPQVLALTPKFFESAVNKDSGDICVFFHHQTWTDVSTRRSVPVATIKIMETLNLCLTSRSEIYQKCCSTFMNMCGLFDVEHDFTQPYSILLRPRKMKRL